ncbi:MAG: DUF4157 domain-containing protein [Bacteroidota bacterium]
MSKQVPDKSDVSRFTAASHPKTTNKQFYAASSVENSQPTAQLQKLQSLAGQNTEHQEIARLQELAASKASQQPFQRKENRTTLPDQLKEGIEHLSGHAMDDVAVHYHSAKPAQLQAHAYAQGNQIYLASGQEKYLAHEAWHVVQQKQGRVKPTHQLKGDVRINDDTNLEKEADAMGSRLQKFTSPSADFRTKNQAASGPPHHEVAQLAVKKSADISKNSFNIIGENHSDSGGKNREKEKELASDVFDRSAEQCYWEEQQFHLKSGKKHHYGDPYELRGAYLVKLGVDQATEILTFFASISTSLKKNHGMLATENDPLASFLAENGHDTTAYQTTDTGSVKKSIGQLKTEVDDFSKSAATLEKELNLMEDPGYESQLDGDLAPLVAMLKGLSDQMFTLYFNFDDRLKKLTELDLENKTIVEEFVAKDDLTSKAQKQLKGTLNRGLMKANNLYLKKIEKLGNTKKVKGQLQNQRSYYMHEAGKQAVERSITGIWKIGQKHVEDIENGLKETEESNPYVLIDMNVFWNKYMKKKS